MNIVEFPNPSLDDIPAMMRRLADAIEKGSVQASSVICVVEAEDDVSIYSWGFADSIRAHWLLCVAQRELE